MAADKGSSKTAARQQQGSRKATERQQKGNRKSIERQQKGNRKPTKTISSIFAKNYRKQKEKRKLLDLLIFKNVFLHFFIGSWKNGNDCDALSHIR